MGMGLIGNGYVYRVIVYKVREIGSIVMGMGNGIGYRRKVETHGKGTWGYSPRRRRPQRRSKGSSCREVELVMETTAEKIGLPEAKWRVELPRLATYTHT